MLENMGDCGCEDELGFVPLTSGARLLGSAAAMKLLASVDYGRVVFSLKSVPTIARSIIWWTKAG